jgi:hypothetical protein
MRLNKNQILSPRSHQSCSTSSLSICSINCIANLSLYLNKFLDELSRVFFQKQDMRSKAWWLPIFYSFCIQAVVRKALKILTIGTHSQPSELEWVKEYLHLAIRLFISASGRYDPLTQSFGDDGSAQSEDLPTLEDYEAARVALGIPRNDFISSSDYLKRIFEDSGEPLSYNALPQRAISPDPIGSATASSYGYGNPFSSTLSQHHSLPSPHTQASEYRTKVDYSSSSCTPSTASSSGTGIAATFVNRLHFDTRTNPQIGGFECIYPGCTAQPFQTQASCIQFSSLHRIANM